MMSTAIIEFHEAQYRIGLQNRLDDGIMNIQFVIICPAERRGESPSAVNRKMFDAFEGFTTFCIGIFHTEPEQMIVLIVKIGLRIDFDSNITIIEIAQRLLSKGCRHKDEWLFNERLRVIYLCTFFGNLDQHIIFRRPGSWDALYGFALTIIDPIDGRRGEISMWRGQLLDTLRMPDMPLLDIWIRFMCVLGNVVIRHTGFPF